MAYYKISKRELQQFYILRDRAFHKQRGVCHWCGCEMIKGAQGQPQQLTGDHVVPLWAGGKSIPGNIVAACLKCNNRRNAEAERGSGGLVLTVGDDRPASPFQVLAQMIHGPQETP